ncbi:MAG: ATP-binding protein [Rhodospirillaceae bacterium]
MTAAPLPTNEKQRLERLRKYGILDTPPEEAFDRIVRLAATILDVPIATISLIDDGRQWFKARVGIEAPETTRDVAFCAHAILGKDIFVVNDATQNPLFSDNPLVTGDPNIRFYAGAPLTTHDGFNLGTVCGIDCKPRTVTSEQKALLRDLGALVVDQMELRAAGRTALAEVDERIRVDAFKSAFISTVNHELRTPLTSIIGAIELITSGAVGEVTPEVAELLTIADRNSAVLLRLINDLLDSAKIADGNLNFDTVAVDLDRLISESVENIAGYLRDHQIAVTYQRGQKTMVNGDKVRLTQVMNNLLSNAVKFSPRGSEVRVTLAARGGKAEVSVIDRAGGIPESIRGRIFEKFVQADRGVNQRPGTGLGLSIAKAIIEQLGGEIGFETEPGVGTRFYFSLPLI